MCLQPDSLDDGTGRGKEGLQLRRDDGMGVLLFASGGSGAENLSIFAPVTPQAEAIRTLSVLVLFIAAVIFLVVEGALFWCVWRFRQRRREIAAATTSEPPQLYGSNPIEIAWTAAPGMIVFILALVTARTLWEVKKTPPRPGPGDSALFVTVIGRQWWWEYRYESYDGRKLSFTTANELHVPASENNKPRPVHLTLQSADVIHSFWAPRLGGKMDLIPGKSNYLSFAADRPGLYLGQCAEFCGTQHAGMLIRVVVDTPQDFERWLNNEKQPSATEDAVADGRKLFLSLSCIDCHRVEGTRARGAYAPDLTHLLSRKTIASGTLPNTPANLRAWVSDPQKLRPGCLMPDFNLSKQEVERVVEYLLTLR